MSILDRLPDGPLARVGMVARWKPVHAVHAVILNGLCALGRQVLIGIGSSNRYSAANPFTAQESAEMIRRVLAGKDNYALCEIPDLGDGPRWAEMVRGHMDDLDLFVTANAWVRDLMERFYPVLHPVHLVPSGRRSPLSGSDVRRAMARGEAWQDLVPPEVAAYLEERGLVTRLRREFGSEILGHHKQ